MLMPWTMVTGVAAVPANAVRASEVASAADAMLYAGAADALLLIVLLAAVGAAALLAFRAWNEGREAHAGEDDLPPLVFPTPPPRRQGTGPGQTAGAVRAPRARPVALEPPGLAPPAPRPRTPAPAQGEASKSPARKRTNGQKAASTMADATLQILPGRLEVLGGDAGLEEIRFVRGAGSESAITLGRSEGAPPDHVQLHSAAVSRMHVRMRFDGGRWYVTNLSQTNPTLVNGVALEPDGGERLLRDGDQLELGDVVLRFRS
jgi:pSer/pThr/pTyr-binding forkhead associated (FHA) protein